MLNPPLNQPLHTARPHCFDMDVAPQPSFEQVARSMARALHFSTPCFHIQERQFQIEEGRKMARSDFSRPLPRTPRGHYAPQAPRARTHFQPQAPRSREHTAA